MFKYSPVLHRQANLRLWLMTAIIVAGTATLVWKLWQVQVVDGPKYAACVATSSEVRVRIPPLRGEIRDRNGLILASNRARLDVEFYLPEMVRAFRERNEVVPTVRYPGRVHGMLKMLSEPDIAQIVDTAVVPQLRRLGLRTDIDRERLARHFRINAEVPFTFLEGADFPTIARFAEHDLGLPGVRLEATPVRQYPLGALAAHILGYVGDPPEISALPDADDFDYYRANVEGKSDVEFLMDRYLRGTPGVRVMHRNARGAIDAEKYAEPPVAGSTVYLTIDARIQAIADQALRYVGRAGAVVVDPNNGDILAMASVPSFNPNLFVAPFDAATWNELTRDETHPLVNRAISAFPPGSTFKIITALAGLRKGLAQQPFDCSGGVSYGDHYFQCWKSSGHGKLTLSDAIMMSCNAFFYQYGNAAGIDSIDAIGTLLGLGQSPGTGLNGEQAGVLPGPAWLRLNAPAERWSSAYTANVSIGQGFDLVSPLQLVLAYSAIANGGVAWNPRLIEKVVDGNGLAPRDGEGRPVLAKKPQPRGNLLDGQVSRADLELVRQGFWRVVNEDGGTARRARLDGGIVAGKTGTAQAKRDGHDDTIAWFVCFAPFDAPRYAVCVMVQGGAHGGSVAAPIAARILEETFAMENGTYTPALVAVPPARHPAPFQMIESLTLPSAEGASTKEAAVVSATQPPRAKRAAATTTVTRRVPQVRLAQPVEQPVRRPNFFERLFGSKPTR